MKTFKILVVVLYLFSQAAVNSQTFNSTQGFIVKSDPRVELLNIVFMLAGNQEYNRSLFPAYKNDVMNYFDKYKDHEVVKLAINNRNKFGVSYDAVMSMAVHISNTITLEERVPFASKPEKFEKRWTPENARLFLIALKDFVAETDFNKFISDHSELYKVTDQKLNELVNNYAKLDWYESFFGKRASGQFILVPGYLTGGGNYGNGFKDAINGIDEMYSITALSNVDKDGVPSFDPLTAQTIIHEFCHSFVNHIVEKHIEELKDAGTKMYPFVSQKMMRQAYGFWTTMMSESVVRACVNRYLRKNGSEASVASDIKNNIERGFIWMDDFVKLFDEYENDRKAYSNLDEFFPKIVEFFNAYSKTIKDKVELIEKEKEAKLKEMKEKGPKIVSIQPANGDDNVDPATDGIIITFDRAMKNPGWAFILGNKAFPTIEGSPSYENGNKVLKLKVKLKPNTEYEYWLNSDSGLGFKSADNIPLVPTLVKFKTK